MATNHKKLSVRDIWTVLCADQRLCDRYFEKNQMTRQKWMIVALAVMSAISFVIAFTSLQAVNALIGWTNLAMLFMTASNAYRFMNIKSISGIKDIFLIYPAIDAYVGFKYRQNFLIEEIQKLMLGDKTFESSEERAEIYSKMYINLNALSEERLVDHLKEAKRIKACYK